MGKRASERSLDQLELKYPYGNKRLRFSRLVLYTKETVDLLNQNSITEMPYVYVKPREEFLAEQASKEDNRLNLEDYFDASSMAVSLLSTKRFNISCCRKAVREIQFLEYFEKLGWNSDLITDYCQNTLTDINTLINELKALYFSLKESNVNVDKIIEKFSKDSQSVKLFFEYLTKYLQSLSTRKPVIVLERTEIDPKLNLSQDSLKRKKQEISDRNKVGKVRIETIDDTDYQESKRATKEKTASESGDSLNDPAKAAADANAAAWAAYYNQFYNQPGQPQPQPGQIVPAQPAAQPATAPAQNSAGQADYSAAWVEYYRSLGMFREADMIEQQARGGQAPGAQTSNPGTTPGAPISTGIAPQVTTGATQPAPAGTPAAQPAAAPVAAAGYPGSYPAPGQQPQPVQVPYGQPAPYPGYNYAAAYGSQQQFSTAAHK